jgi:S-adenosylmethionine hydrolase
MKGAALTVNPDLRFVDVSHEVEPQRILEGALILASVFDHFPPGTIFVAVVDPGVGGERRILAAEVAGRALLAPDNGLAAPLLAARGAERLHAVVEARYFRPRVHPTFHGRDVFAPVAAHLALGVPTAALGPPLADPVALDIPRPRAAGGRLEGEVLHVDRFGNLVTNVTEEALDALGGRGAVVEAGGRVIAGVSRTYAEGDDPLRVVVGSWGYLEIALRGGSAARLLGLGVGGAVRVRPSGRSA